MARKEESNQNAGEFRQRKRTQDNAARRLRRTLPCALPCAYQVWGQKQLLIVFMFINADPNPYSNPEKTARHHITYSFPLPYFRTKILAKLAANEDWQFVPVLSGPG
jgi:hypothetical protein